MSQSTKNSPAPRNQPEPTAGTATISVWMVVLFGALFFGCQIFLSESAGGFTKQVYAPFGSVEEVAAHNPHNPEEEFLAMGQDVFNKTCAACHQPNGLGKDGVAPPLVGSEWVLAKGPNRIAHAVLNGLAGHVSVKGKDWNLVMVPWRDVYDDQPLAAALSYVRNTWGNSAPLVKPEEVAAARKDVHPGPETEPEMNALPEKAPGM